MALAHSALANLALANIALADFSTANLATAHLDVANLVLALFVLGIVFQDLGCWGTCNGRLGEPVEKVTAGTRGGHSMDPVHNDNSKNPMSKAQLGKSNITLTQQDVRQATICT